MKANQHGRANQREADVTVSELAAFSYCAKAWHLERVVGVSPHSNAAVRREAGINEHRSHGAAVHATDARRRYATFAFWSLLVAAALCALVAIILG